MSIVPEPQRRIISLKQLKQLSMWPENGDQDVSHKKHTKKRILIDN